MTDLGIFFAARLALNLTPGPDMLCVVTRSATEGRAAGIVQRFGIAARLEALGTHGPRWRLARGPPTPEI